MESSRPGRIAAPPTEVGAVVVARPPDPPKASPANGLMRLVPVMMLVAGAGMVALYFTSGAGTARNPAALLFPAMMLTSALGSLVYATRGSGRAELDEARRDYVAYLDDVDDTAAKTAEAQRRSSWWRHPEPGSLWTLADTARRWERVPGDDDFGHVRIGIGPAAPYTPLVAPELEAGRVTDPVTAAALHGVLERRSTVADVPVTVDLTAHAVVVVGGEAAHARATARALVCQLATFHGPADVSVAVVVGPETAPEWDWVKWLPHHGRTHRDVRHVDSRVARTVVLFDGGTSSRDHLPDGMTVVAIGDLPPSLRTLDVLRVDAGEGAVDAITPTQAVVCARRLARHAGARSPGAAGARTAWRPLLDGTDPGPLWRMRGDRELLRVRIGVDDGGLPVDLDLKESARGGMGPHGLCVGATGSGKSELLRSLTLGLVATHPPDVLNLVLVDFKGGATFLGFERLNHVAAVITNLAAEAHLVARMHDALTGELTRRQELLRDAGNLANVGDYQTARSRGAALDPLPTLFIVVDEFSELLSQHPDLVESFVAIGRLGRSLGMHLLLSSQRLEEGRLRGLDTHLSYRICLKTFSAGESRAVLGTADAVELPNTPGAAYLKTASGELLRFRSDHASVAAGPGRPDRSPEVPLVTSFTAIPVGRTDRATQAGSRTELDAALDLLSGHGAPAHRVWLPPLTSPPTLGALSGYVPSDAPLTVPIGLVDDACAQRRLPLVVDLRDAGGHVAVVGGPRSGKSTTLQTLVLALAATHHPAAVQIYGLDFGGGALSATSALPHVGAIAGRSERDLGARIVSRVQSVIRRRETAPRGEGPGDEYGEVFLVVDGWAAARQELDWLEESVTSIAAQGLSVGVHVVVAAARWAELRPALKDQLGTRLELRLGDPAESEFDRKRARLLAGRPAGFGITRDGLEMAIAGPTFGAPNDPWSAAAALVRRRHPDAEAPPVRTLPSVVGYDAVVARSLPEVILGLGGEDVEPVAVDFVATPHVLVVGESRCGKTAALRTLCREIVRVNATDAAHLLVVDLRRGLLGVVEDHRLRAYAMTLDDVATRMTVLADELRARLPAGTVTQRQLRDRSWWSGPDVYVVVDDYELVAAAPLNPLGALLDLVPYARDVGLHLVVARGAGGSARAMFDPVLAALREGDALGLSMSASADEGSVFGSHRPTLLPPGRATLIRRGRAGGQVQLALAEAP